MMHVVMRLRTYETPLSHDDARRGKVLHPVASLELVADPHLSLHGGQNLDALALLSQNKSMRAFARLSNVNLTDDSRGFHKGATAKFNTLW